MKTVVITRKFWGKGALRKGNAKRCCLGFVSEALGVSPKDTLGITMPARINIGKSKLPKWMKDMISVNADVNVAAKINDDHYLSIEEKERQLKKLFLKHNIRLVFRGPTK